MRACLKKRVSVAFWIVLIFVWLNFCGLTDELTKVHSISNSGTHPSLISRLARRATVNFAIVPSHPEPIAHPSPVEPESHPAPVFIPVPPRSAPSPEAPPESVPNAPPRSPPAPPIPPLQPSPALTPPKYAPGYAPGSFRPAPVGRTEIPPKPLVGAIAALALVSLTLDNLQDEVDYDNAARYYLKGLPRPYMLPDDPPDSAINSPFYYNGTRIYKKNPCEHYSEGSKKRSNKDHKNGCRKARNRMAKIMPKVPSARCPDVGWARCFKPAEYGLSGRCYVLVNQGDPSKIHFELITRCTPA